MSKNYMEKVAQMLGVEMGEKFTVKCYETCEFYITENGLHCNRVELPTKIILSNIMTGEEEIIKIPKRKHTGLENVAKKDETVYILFGFRQGVSAIEPAELQTDFFTDKEIRDNWERYIDIKKRLAKAASELNTEPIDWNDCRQEKWYICCPNRETLTCYHIDGYPNDGVFFTSKEAAQKAIEIVGKVDLIWMLRDFQPFIGYSTEVTE